MAIQGYEYRVDGGAAVEVGLVYEALVEGLSPGVQYGFEIRSYNDEGEFSEWSSVVYETTFGASLVMSNGNVVLDSEGNALTVFV